MVCEARTQSERYQNRRKVVEIGNSGEGSLRSDQSKTGIFKVLFSIKFAFFANSILHKTLIVNCILYKVKARIFEAKTNSV